MAVITVIDGEVLYMDENGEKKGFGIAEKIFDIVCLAASYGILFALPQKITPLFYLIFGIAAFLFCIGFFRLGLLLTARPVQKERF